MISSVGAYSPLPLRPAGAAPSGESTSTPKLPGPGAEQEAQKTPTSAVGRDPIRPLIDGGLVAAVQQQDHSNAAKSELKERVNGHHDEAAEESESEAGISSEHDKAGAQDEDGLGELTEEQQAEIKHLKSEDTRVRNHEAAHASAGGAHAGSPQFGYTTGPDGKRYATSGSVPIDIAPVGGDPEATLRKMDQVKRAALAPADPSGADRAVAAQADQIKQQAQRELRELRAEERKPEETEETQRELPGQDVDEPTNAGQTAGSTPDGRPDSDTGSEFARSQFDGLPDRNTGSEVAGAQIEGLPDGNPGSEIAGNFEQNGNSENRADRSGLFVAREYDEAQNRLDDRQSGADGATSSSGGLTQSQVDFTQAIEAYQRASGANSDPRFTSFQ